MTCVPPRVPVQLAAGSDLLRPPTRTPEAPPPRMSDDVGPPPSRWDGGGGGGDDDDVGVHVEAVHLYENLVQRLLTFVVAAANARAPMPADSVYLINENN